MESNDKNTFYAPTRLERLCFWVKNHPGDVIFTSGLMVMGTAIALIFGVGGSAAVAGLFLILFAGILLCGKAAFPESNEEEMSYRM